MTDEEAQEQSTIGRTTSTQASSELDEPAFSDTTAESSDPGESEPEPSQALDDVPLGLPQTEFVIPVGMAIEQVTIGQHMVAVAWLEGAGQVLWRVGDNTGDATSIETLFSESAVEGEPIFAEVSDVVAFDDRFFAFIAGDPNADDESPTVLVSDDGQTWERSPSTIVSGSSTNLPRTPDSPPYAGASAVMHAIAVGDRIHATGWVTIDGKIRTAVWDSPDGENWRLQVIDQIAFDSEYGGSIAHSAAGTIVRIAGPVHTGVGTVVSTRRGEWSLAPVVDDSSYGQQIGANDGHFYNLIRRFDGSVVLRVYDDSVGSSQDVDVGFARNTDVSVRLDASSWHDPVLIVGALFTGHDTDPMRIWTLDRGLWESSHLDGDRLAGIDACFIVTVDEDTLYRFDRSHNGEC